MNFRYPLILVIGVVLTIGVLILHWLLSSQRSLKVANLSSIKLSSTFQKLRRRHQILHIVKWYILVICLLSLVCLSARPYTTTLAKSTSDSSDVVIALDVSRSMEPYFKSMSQAITTFINSAGGNNIGLVLIAGKPQALVAPGTNYDQFTPILNDLKQMNSQDFLAKWSTAPPGSAIGDGIALSSSLFGQNNPRQKTIIVATDGNINRGQALQDISNYSITHNIHVLSMVPDNPDASPESLKMLSQQTGGKFIALRHASDVSQAFDDVRSQVRSPHIILAYHEIATPFIITSILSWGLYMLLDRRYRT